ncbi:hypothetical protein GGF40_004306 [Coemansia sp. RSA 1286]|nr:hypothetical protein GGF40_004306 [Coemansia sp. RSA 1286]
MNSFFGGSPLGASRSSTPASNKATASSNAAPPSTASASASSAPIASPAAASGGGLGSWGSMFKSALNQVETHLDRYLELPADSASPGGARTQTQTHTRLQANSQTNLRQPPRSSSSLSTPRARQPSAAAAAATAATAAVPIPNSAPRQKQQLLREEGRSLSRSLSQASLSRSGPGLARSNSSRAAGDARETAGNDGLDASLLDAFGVELDNEPQTGAKPTPSDTAAPASAPAPAPSSAAAAVTDNAYIQAELRKLRSTAVPSKLRSTAVPSSPDEMRAMIDAFSKRIEALLLEGQQWSAKELRLSNAVKKLRAESSGLEKAAHAAQRNLDAAVAKNDDLTEKLRLATASDRSSSAKIRTELAAAFAATERQLRGQIDELQSAAVAAQDRMQDRVRDLQQRAMAAEEDARDRELASLAQIRALKTQLRAAELQSTDVSSELQQHTRPLLQQIEDLQLRLADHRRDWARREAELTAQARDAAKEALELQRDLQQKTADLAALRSQLTVEAKRRDDLLAESKRLADQLHKDARARADLKRQLDDAQATIRQLGDKLDAANSLRAATAAESLTRGGSPLGRTSPPATTTGQSHVRSPSVCSASSTDSRPRRSSAAETHPPALGAAHPMPDAAAQASAKKLGAQITSLKAQLQTALKQKNEYSRSMVELEAELDGLRKKDADQDQLARDLDELKLRHETALVMLGEKTERVAELEADISEIKDAYRQQLESIFQK